MKSVGRLSLKLLRSSLPRNGADNCRTFVDNFVSWVVTHDPAWQGRVGLARSGNTVVAPVRSFPTPLEYITWRRRKLMYMRNTVKARVHNHRILFNELPAFSETSANGVVSDSPPMSTSSDEESLEMDVKSDVTDYTPSLYEMMNDDAVPIPALSIVMLVVGSRGDVQPFIALGQELLKHGHRVRLATHETFRKFVNDSGLEFYPLAGDPAELMAYMVKNPGLLPGFESIRMGDIQKKRTTIRAILASCWDACVKTDDANVLAFTADAIIANPVSFGHIHCAEKLMIPLHIFFTMPYTPTTAFPHPITTLSQSPDAEQRNYLSYDVVEMMTWQGLGDIINDFRVRILGLDGLYNTNGPFLLKDLVVPHTYIWSPELVPKPKDWGPHIDICGFFFLDLATNYTPDPELEAFLRAGPPPIYIGFGSIVVDDPDGLTRTVFEAVERAGVRAILSKGWGGIGGESLSVPENVYLIGNVPHDWLFQHVRAVVHHGGAGTTAAGLRAGKPTVIVPFFGDQPFWGAMVHQMNVGSAPIPHEDLTASNLSEAITYALTPEVRNAAHKIGAKLNTEDGVKNGARSFHARLPLRHMCCDIDPSRVAVYYSSELDMKISEVVGVVLVHEGLIDPKSLKPYASKFWNTQGSQPVTRSLLTTLNVTTTEIGKGITDLFRDTGKAAWTLRSNPSGSLTTGGMAVLKVANTPGRVSAKFVGRFADSMRTAAAQIEGKQASPAPIITDAASGLQEGLKSFGKGLSAVGSIAWRPYQGAKTEGLVGAGKGFVQGVGMAVAKPLSGTLDLVHFTGKGIVKSTKASAARFYEKKYGKRFDSSNSFGTTSSGSSSETAEDDILIPIPPLPPRIASEIFTERVYLQLPTEAISEIVARFMERIQFRTNHTTALSV
ncbi:hypothetical protein BJ742DRAFT_825144 [Cladochytrium replicatum]|nr:hypothetical protein BJ742DRAFT_825144 [Cladochytrium replicatum]